jgi:hypothetical protein
MASCMYDMPRSACSVALETYHGASTIILRILDWLLWIIDMLDIWSNKNKQKKTPWRQSANKLYRPSDRSLSVKSVLTFADRWCRVVSMAVPYGRILWFPDRSRYYFFQLVL